LSGDISVTLASLAGPASRVVGKTVASDDLPHSRQCIPFVLRISGIN